MRSTTERTHPWSSSERSERTVETTPRKTKNKPKPRQVVLHVHLSDAAIRGDEGLHLARVENTRTGVTAEQVRTWCANPDTSVVVKPVIDLNEHIHVNGYEVPERLQEQTEERDHTCVPVVQPAGEEMRFGALHPLRPGWDHLQLQHRTFVSTTSPT